MDTKTGGTKKLVKKAFRYFFITLGSLTLLIIAAALVIAVFFEKEVKQFAVAQINKELNTQIKVKDIRLSLLRKFPNASLEFIDVSCKEVTEDSVRQNLLEAESIFLQFSVLDIFRKNYTFKKLNIRNGSIFLHIDKDGKNNFSILKEKPRKKKSGQSDSFRFNEITVSGMTVIYRDDMRDQEYNGTVKSLAISGNFSEKQYQTKGDGDIFVRTIRLNGQEYVANRSITFSAALDINSQQKRYSISKAKLSIEDLTFSASGHFVADSTNYIDLRLKGEKLNIGSFLSVLPASQRRFQEEYRSDGNFYFNTEIRGSTSNGKTPFITAAFGIQKGEITHIPTGMKMRNANVKGTYTNGKHMNAETSVLVLSQVEGTINRSQISGNFTMINFARPEVIFHTNSNVDLKDIHTFFPVENIEYMEGLARVNLSFRGKTSNGNKFTIEDFQRSTTTGKIELSGIKMKIRQSKNAMTNTSGLMLFENSDVTIRHLQGMVGVSDFIIRGTIYNLPAYLIVPGADLNVAASLQSGIVDLNELIGNDKKVATGTQKASYKFRIPRNIHFDLNLDVKRVVFRLFEAKNIRGNVGIRNRIFSANQVTMDAMDGTVLVNGGINNSKDDVRITCEGKFSRIDIKRMFREFENFDQKTLEDRHIAGRMDAAVTFSCTFDASLKADLSSVLATAQIKLTEGQLTGFKPLEALSKFIRVDELKNIKFETLINYIDIRDRTIFIPNMEIRNSALNINLSGQHRFDNIIDYRFNVLLKDVLSKKFRRNNSQDEFGEIIEEEGGARAFIKMTGNANDPKISYDMQGVGKKIKEDLKKENQTIRQMLREEMGLFKNDSTLKHENALPKKENPNKIEDSDGFEFE